MGEVSLTSEGKRFQASVSMMRWYDAQGGHFEDEGVFIDDNGNRKIDIVPQHRHHVTLNIYRVDVGLKYQLGSQWMLEANIPFESKVQEASIEKIDDVEYTEEQWAAIKENGRIHHRDDTYPGLTDSDIFLGHYRLGVFKEDDFLMGRIGTTIPLGKAEEDPWKLGEMGAEHLHIQFGTGTFNPVADVHYNFPIYKGLATHTSLRAKLPFYENSKTYRGSRELTYSAGLNYRLNKWFSFQAGYLGIYQSFAHWDGEIDKNTGLLFGMASLGTSITTPFNVSLSLSLLLPLHQKTLYDDTDALDDGEYEESDAFEFGPLVSVTVLYSF
jgi:hypothetical protein